MFSADEIAHELYAPGGPAYSLILNAFGLNFRLPDGTLDRKKLRDFIFEDSARKKIFEGILHPQIARESQARFEKAFKEGETLVFYEAPVLIEAQQLHRVDGLLLVTSPLNLRIQHLLKRDPSLTPEKARAIFNQQMPEEEKAKYANWVIENTGTIEQLYEKVEKWLSDVQST